MRPQRIGRSGSGRTGQIGVPVSRGVCESRTKPVIGLAGGIGAGKSTVAQELAKLGAVVLDFDQLARVELEKPDAKEAIRGWWGDSIFLPDGSIDRSALAAIVFHDAKALERLEGLLYPRLRRLCRDELGRLDQSAAGLAIVLDAPKLYEAGLDELCDAIIFVEADRDTRLDRVQRIRGWMPSEWERRENLQNPLDMKRSKADYIVINHGSIEHLRSQVERVFKSVLSSFT